MRPGWLALALFACLCLPASAFGDHRQESIFQDDQYLLYSPTATVDDTLAVLQSLGVDRVRITVKWSAIAPAPFATTRPSGFDATNPAAYPSGAWAPYDRVLTLAASHGISVDFNLTVPGPLWAMQPSAPEGSADHWEPSPVAFEQFAQAVGTRYSGSYDGLPRVSFWTIWNEPNQPGWLAPQSLSIQGAEQPISPALYRYYVQAGFAGLYASGHNVDRDTILIGELAPEGYDQGGTLTAMTPGRFLRALYCVDGRFRRLRGSAAAVIGCPSGRSAASFVNANLGLFYASGFAHHPYYFFWPPEHSASDPDFMPLANLGRLERTLDRACAAYGVARKLPIYLTEYGYQTNPPDPYEIVSPAQQAKYLNEADYMAWRDPRVRSVAQFLLLDSPPNPTFPASDPDHWNTFQTGLEYVDGSPKPSLAAYRMPIWIPVARGHRVFVWGQVRPHPRSGSASIQWARPHGRWRTLARVRPGALRGFIARWVKVPGRGVVRISFGGMASRGVAVRGG
jgi:hypothetical protein